MEYTNENFEIFQDRLSHCELPDSLLWELRDAVFCEAFYGRERKLFRLYNFPYGEYLYLFIEWLRALPAIKKQKPLRESGQAHFLFCSPRNNHINRIYPLFKETVSSKSCIGWVSDPNVFKHLDDADQDRFADISGRWAECVRPGDIQLARKYCRILSCRFADIFSPVELRKIKVYLVMFFAWRRFWHGVMDENIDEVYCTFEKNPVVKSFFFVAKEQGAGRRVHWIHGLRHASIQATLSTELWCMTEGDVRFFGPRVPDYCTPKVKRNPETDLLVESVGVRTPADRDASQPVRFLFLGPGLETSYTGSMRRDDLAIIKKAQKTLGSQVEWRFRPHPSVRERFKEELVKVGVEVDDFSSRDLVDDLKWADAVGSSWSSLLLDVRETGRPIFWVQSEIRTLGGVDELIADGVGTHVSESLIANELVRIFSLKGDE